MLSPNGNGTNRANGEVINGGTKSQVVNTLQLENLLLREDDVFSTSSSLNSGSNDYIEDLAPIIKDAVRNNALSDLITKLNDIVKQKDEDLNKVSMSSMSEINQCMDTIANIHQKADSLNRQFLAVSQSLSKSSIELITKKKNYVKSKEVCNRISEAQVVLNECVQVLELMNKILELIKQTKYFSALKLIDELTNIHIQKVGEFSFAQKIVDSIPHLTKMVKDDSFENLIKWLSLNLERKLTGIGDALYDNLYELQENWIECKRKNQTYMPYKLNSPVELSLRDPGLNYCVFDDETLQIPLSSVYDAILVYRTLHELDSLNQIYYKEWMKKYGRIIYPITSASSSKKEIVFDSKMLDDYLRKIAAFFVMDKQLNLLTKFQLRTNVQADELWMSYVSKLKPVLIYTLKSNDFYDLDDLGTFKDIIGDFMQVMDSNEYDVSELYEVMMIIFKDYFAPLVVQTFRKKFVESLQSEFYTALQVNKEEYEGVMRRIFYDQNAPFAQKNIRYFPVTFPFSEDYVHYCGYVRTLINKTLKFTNTYYLYEVNEINNIIVNNIVEVFLSNRKGFGIAWEIEDFIKKNENNKEVIAQSFVNLEYYLLSLYKVGVLLNQKLRQNTGMGILNIDTNDTFTLTAVEAFTKLRKFSEDTVYKMVDTKITELLESVEYDDYLPVDRNTEANFAVKDFAMFLENLFTSIFENLPSQIRTLGLFRSYDFISQHLLGVLKNASEFNETFIDNFDLDIQYLEKSMKNLSNVTEGGGSGSGSGSGGSGGSSGAEAEGAEGEGGGGQGEDSSQGNVSIKSTFSELRQTVDLLKSQNFEEYLTNSSFRMRQYNSIKFEDGKKLINKMQGVKTPPSLSYTSPVVPQSSQFQRSGTIKSLSHSISGGNFASIIGNRNNDDANSTSAGSLESSNSKFTHFTERFKQNKQ
ncbi:SEC15 [Candida oxycetoniae]|uniref:Exocyst complex component SEC15 n=1 Tax=Candida oxycetoniae TaxID=497107 RepID=A0AAI9SUH3_9ASCO|nr:SEC15 [Candida oxycetoniae]KAI3403166.2 SEC15 [Candida oxycetoniae]